MPFLRRLRNLLLMGLGAALMYLLDPVEGASRRAMIMSRLGGGESGRDVAGNLHSNLPSVPQGVPSSVDTRTGLAS